MKRGEFKEILKSIGFNDEDGYYVYKHFKIRVWGNDYDIHDGYGWINGINFSDVNTILKLIRSYKLKQLLK